jgi:hypothetical protein
MKEVFFKLKTLLMSKPKIYYRDSGAIIGELTYKKIKKGILDLE